MLLCNLGKKFAPGPASTHSFKCSFKDPAGNIVVVYTVNIWALLEANYKPGCRGGTVRGHACLTIDIYNCTMQAPFCGPQPEVATS